MDQGENFFDIFVWDGPAIALLDLDAFFTSVEQLDHPEYRGKPVIVGGSPKKRGVVSTASYEARAFGVHSAMPSAQAARLCPNAIWVAPTPGHFERYHTLSQHVMEIIYSHTPFIEQTSIDEAFFDITPGRYAKTSPIEMCQTIQARVKQLGISCSIGLATNKSVAKIASEREKPHGLTVVLPGLERNFLAPLPVKVMPGIGQQTASRLHTLGIYTLKDLAEASESVLRENFGIIGPRLKICARGEEHNVIGDYQRPSERKSISKEYTFETNVHSKEQLISKIQELACSLARRMHGYAIFASCVHIKLRHEDLGIKTAQKTLHAPTDSQRIIAETAVQLLCQILGNSSFSIRLVGVGVSQLTEDQDRPATQLEIQFP